MDADIAALGGGGFDLSAAVELLEVDECAVVFTRNRKKGLLSRLVKNTTPTSTPPHHTMAAPLEEAITQMRRTDEEALIIAWRTTTTNSRLPGGRLTAAGANLVISNAPSRTSIKRSQGRALVRLGTALPDADGRSDETLKWDLKLLTDSADAGSLTLQMSAHAVAGESSRSLTTEEIGELYADALLRTSRTQLFLELVDGKADNDSSHLSLTLGATGEFAPASREFPTARAEWVEEERTLFTADPGLLSTPRVVQYELERRGFSVDAVTPNYLLAETRDAQISYFFSNSHRAPQTSVRAAADKSIARTIMERAGVPVAEGRYFADSSQLEDAESLLDTLGTIVVKPVDASHGNGVSVGVTTRDALRSAWSIAFDVAREGVVIERHVEGVEARFTVVNDKCVAVACARPPRIVGDGHSTVRDLVNQLNDRRRQNPHLANRPVLFDEHRIQRLRDHNLSPLTVLPAGYGYDVAKNTSWYGGTTTEDITDEVDASYKEFAVAAVQAIPGLAVAGLDVIMSDYAKPAAANPFVVLEINTQPGLGIHHFPMVGTPRNVAGAIIDADLAQRRPETFDCATTVSGPHGQRPKDPHRATAAIGDELTHLGFDVDWLSDDYFHAHREGTSTAVWRSYTALTGKSAASAAQHPRVSHSLLTRAGVPTPRSWRAFIRDSEPGRFQNGRQALDYALTLNSPVLRVSNRSFVGVDATDTREFQEVWERLARNGQRGVVVAEKPTGHRAHILVSHGSALAVRWADESAASFAESAELDRTYLTTAVRATHAFQGLDLAEVVLHVDTPSVAATSTNHTISVVRPAPDLTSFESIKDGAGRTLYQVITAQHVEGLMTLRTAS